MIVLLIIIAILCLCIVLLIVQMAKQAKALSDAEDLIVMMDKTNMKLNAELNELRKRKGTVTNLK